MIHSLIHSHATFSTLFRRPCARPLVQGHDKKATDLSARLTYLARRKQSQEANLKDLVASMFEQAQHTESSQGPPPAGARGTAGA